MSTPHIARHMFGTDAYTLREGQRQVARLKHKNVILTAPCGYGKTEAAQLWMGDTPKRVVYTMPMRVLTNQTQDRLNEYASKIPNAPQWTIQHSGAKEDVNFEAMRIATTIDQVASRFLALGRNGAIGGKNLMQADLVVDEVQLLEGGRTLQLLIQLLDQTTRLGNNFLLMTATMPDELISFFEKRYDAHIVKVEESHLEDRKNTIHSIKTMPFDSINAYTQKQIIMTNSQNEQLEVLRGVKDKSRCILLNSYLLPTDREEMEKEAYEHFGKGSPDNNKILITTQVLEAGVDISAGRMITSLCPIDSLIQREGRLSRWGGSGELFVVQDAFTKIYDEDLIKLTSKKVKDLNGQVFDWSVHLECVTEVMGAYYEKLISHTSIRRYVMKMRRGNREELIRDINQVNVILLNKEPQTPEEFQRESVSLSLNQLRKSKSDKMYVLHKGIIQETAMSMIFAGDTIITDGSNFSYGEVGLRVVESGGAADFPELKNACEKEAFEDYVDESWLTHTKEVERVMFNSMVRDGFLTASLIEKENISFLENQQPDLNHLDTLKLVAKIGGLHDLGKLTTNWQRYIGKKDEPMAHRPYCGRAYSIIQGVKHNLISAVALKDVVTKISSNLLMQHHGRIIPDRDHLGTDACVLVPESIDLVKATGWTHGFYNKVKSSTIRSTDLLYPTDKEWGVFLYLLGTLMESDVKAIRNVRQRVKSSQ